jgi:hypothetical protein
VNFVTPKDHKVIKKSMKMEPAPGHELNPAEGFRISQSSVTTGRVRGAE